MAPITVETTINSPVEKVWQFWNEPEHIMNWNHASDDWHAPAAKNDLTEGGKLQVTMAARDGSSSFEFIAVYTKLIPNERIEYTMEDGRKVKVIFSPEGSTTKVIETFDPETENTEQLQRSGWQAILDNFKKYVESN